MNNIFENAYFGKTYKTRDGRKAIYIKEKLVHESLSHTDVLYAQLVLETGDILEVVKEIGVSNGTQLIYDNLDIVSEWQEPIDEKELDKLAEHEYPYEYYTSLYGEEEAEYKDDLREAFKAGYRKSIENKKII